MKSTGVVRRVDELGRVVIPIEIRRIHHISEKDPLEIFVEGDSIILKKNESSPTFFNIGISCREKIVFLRDFEFTRLHKK